ncbi:F-box/WD repeat-containing protein 5 isoform X2 [Varanus komodoensis]|uniref:F-box/WD repeat-containing protein 5 isoform X2 n=1 Tax=Varanus komodoensis TaxID=61221 RepID=UPI001CF7D990|nr:F-box/WD repeat-containing protein 5 isoform X2 [Varanus komodoensis]
MMRPGRRPPPRLPDSVLIEIFLHLDYADVLSAGLACRQWHAVAQDEVLWRELFYKYYRVARDVPRHPAASSWYGEFQRLFDTIPCVEAETLTEHSDQVVHLSFSHDGCLFASCSKDCTIKVWRNDLQPSLLHSASLKEFNWSYTQFSEFNADDSLLLVSGVFAGPHSSSSSGEIAVISLGNLHRIGYLTSCSVLWLSNAFQGIESENMNVVKRLFKIQNLNASTIRAAMVVDCGRYGPPGPPPGHKEPPQGEAAAPCRVVDLGSDSEDEEEEGRPQRVARQPGPEDSLWAGAGGGLGHLPTDTLEGPAQPGATELELETKVARLLAKTRTRPPQPDLLSGAGSDKKYLIFTTGCLTYLPHQIGIKQILPHQMTTTGPVLEEERNSDRFFDSLDHVIDFHGCIIGMGLSPDHRYLYVNSRAWPPGCVVSDPLRPPPAAREVDLHVLDLKTMTEAKRVLRAHRAHAPPDEGFIFLDVSKDFVASGAEDHHSYIWDRHYDICVAKLRHDDVVHSVAFSPVEQELLLTAGADSTIKVWRSPRMARILQAERPRPRRPLLSWATNQML